VQTSLGSKIGTPRPSPSSRKQTTAENSAISPHHCIRTRDLSSGVENQLTLNPDTRAGCRGGKYVIHLDVVWRKFDEGVSIGSMATPRSRSTVETRPFKRTSRRQCGIMGLLVCSPLQLLTWKLVCLYSPTVGSVRPPCSRPVSMSLRVSVWWQTIRVLQA
jgi:hypothetical protein